MAHHFNVLSYFASPAPPQLEDFEGVDEVKSKFYTCPHCGKEFNEKAAMVRVE
jgi:hypothetical protein